jgi:hypothetical protein
MKLIKLIAKLFIVVFILKDVTMATAEISSFFKNNEVRIAPNSIAMPLGKILLIRKGGQYCAVKFTNCWTGKTDYDQHAEYESFYLGDKTGDFCKSNVKHSKEEVYYTRPSFTIFGHPVSLGAKKDIYCGDIKLWWSGLNCVTAVYFNRHDQKQGDYGVELAPTNWSDISEVNVLDPRLKWYRYDESRKDMTIPVDRLWDDKESGR